MDKPLFVYYRKKEYFDPSLKDLTSIKKNCFNMRYVSIKLKSWFSMNSPFYPNSRSGLTSVFSFTKKIKSLQKQI